MTDKQFTDEISYQAMASILRNLKEQGLLTDKEYAKIDSVLLRKYRPLLGGLR